MTALDDLCPVPFHDADAPARARILSRLADTELAVALEAEPAGDDAIVLRHFDLPDGPVALACDGEGRLAAFFGAPTAFAAMPGRALAGVLRAGGLGLLVNPGAPSEMLLDAEMLGWLQTALAPAPEPGEAKLRLGAPDAGAVAALAAPLAQRLADLCGLISGAALVSAAGGDAGHVLLIAGAEADHQPAIAKALAEALAFLPEVPGGVDVSFSEAVPPVQALRFDLSPPQTAPRSRPDAPPILR